MNMIQVSARSRMAAVAGAIAGVVREHHRAEGQAIGAGAVNQAVKTLIVAAGYLRLDGIYVSCVTKFADVTIEDKIRTAIKLVVEPDQYLKSSKSADVTTEGNVRTAVEQVVDLERSPDVSGAS